MTKKVIFCLLTATFLFIGGGKAQSSDIKIKDVVNFVNEKYNLQFKQLDQIEPAYLFVYTNALFEQGQKDNAVFLFYLAQYRAEKVAGIENENSKISAEFFKQISADSGAPVIGKIKVIWGSEISRGHLYKSIVPGLGYSINSYTNNNIDKWVSEMEKVVNFEEKHPFNPTKAIPAEQLDISKMKQISEKSKEKMTKLIDYLKNNRTDYEKKLEENRKKVELSKAVGGKLSLFQVSGSQQRYYNKNKKYADSFADLGSVWKDVNGNIPSTNELQEREFKITFYNDKVSPYVIAEQKEGKYTFAKLYDKEEYACIPSKGYEFICSSSLFKNEGYKKSIQELKETN